MLARLPPLFLAAGSIAIDVVSDSVEVGIAATAIIIIISQRTEGVEGRSWWNHSGETSILKSALVSLPVPWFGT